MNPDSTRVISLQDVIYTLSEWDRRYREEPERFQAEAVRLIKGNPESYGEQAGPYFMNILDSILEDRSLTPAIPPLENILAGLRYIQARYGAADLTTAMRYGTEIAYADLVKKYGPESG